MGHASDEETTVFLSIIITLSGLGGKNEAITSLLVK